MRFASTLMTITNLMMLGSSGAEQPLLFPAFLLLPTIVSGASHLCNF